MKVGRPAKRAMMAPCVLLAASLMTPGHASAALASYGGGSITGGVTFQTPIPTFPSFGPDAWQFTGNVTGMVLNTVPSAYIGNVTIQASGSSGSASLSIETGAISATATGSQPVSPTQGYMSCSLTDPLLNGYGRVATTVEVSITGSCNINGFTQNLTWVVVGEFALDPTNPRNGNGISGPIYTADFVGAVQVYPASPF